MPRKRKGKKAKRGTIWTKTGLRFDRRGRIIITSARLRRRIEKQLLTEGDLQIVGQPTTVALNDMCPPTGGPKKPVPNTMCACQFVLATRHLPPPPESIKGGH